VLLQFGAGEKGGGGTVARSIHEARDAGQKSASGRLCDSLEDILIRELDSGKRALVGFQKGAEGDESKISWPSFSKG
jgi:hypothetical protein